MADVITRFKLETTQYDSALRNASQGLSEYAKKASVAGKEFDKFTKSNVDSARALGSISTSATNAKDKVKELVDAYNKLAKAYNDLTKEQQQSDFGKAMAESLTQLKTRIGDAKKELYSMGESGKSTGGIMGQMKDKFMINVDALKLFNVGMKAAKVAINIAKDAFFASEANIDEWGRTVQAAQTLYEGFLTSINTGDISGFLSNMGEITRAAREAYNALDYLQTMKNINAPGTSERQTEITRLQSMLRTGRSIESLTGGKNYGENGSVLTKAQKDAITNDLKALLNDSRGIAENEIKAATDAIDKLYIEQAKVLGMSAEEFKKGTSSMEEFNRMLEGAAQYRSYKSSQDFGYFNSYSTGAPKNVQANPYAQYAAWAAFKDDGKMYQRIIQEIQRRDAAVSSYYGLINQSYRQINRAEGFSPYSASGVGSVKLTGEQMGEYLGGYGYNMRLANMGVNRGLGNKALDARAAGEKMAISEVPIITKDSFLDDEAWQEQLDWLAELEKTRKEAAKAEKQRIKEQEEEAKKLKETWDLVAGSVSTVGGALTSLEDPSAKVAGTLMQALATLAMAFAEASAKAAQTGNSLYWLGFTATGLATFISASQSIKSATKGFAEGGIIGGNSFSGDNQLARVNAGELILSRSQQSTLASQLSGGPANLRLSAVVSGEQIILALNNTTRRQGRGEYVTSKR